MGIKPGPPALQVDFLPAERPGKHFTRTEGINNFDQQYHMPQVSQVALVVKNPPANAGDLRDVSSIPGLGRSPGGGHGNPLQYSCLKNLMDRRVWKASVHWVTKSRTQLKQLSRHTCTMCHIYYDFVIVLTVLYISYLTYILYQPSKKSIIPTISKTVTQRSNVNCPEVF